MRVEVAYARPDRQWLIAVELEAGASARDAVERSGILAACPELDPGALRLGVFGAFLLIVASSIFRAVAHHFDDQVGADRVPFHNADSLRAEKDKIRFAVLAGRKLNR